MQLVYGLCMIRVIVEFASKYLWYLSDGISVFVCWSWSVRIRHVDCSFYRPFSSLYFQGVLRVRKRVTLSVITVSAIFGVCWITGLLIYILSYYDIYMFGPASYAIADTMFMFNSAINPFVYSLLNERFKGKLKGMFCYKCAGRVQPSSEPYSVQLANSTSRVTNTAGACLDWHQEHMFSRNIFT